MTHRFALIRVAVATVRRETLDGIEYLVVPVVMATEGVRWPANSPEPELWLASEYGKSAPSWNGRPVTIQHPKRRGEFVSAAGTPETFVSERIGWVFNAAMEGERLKCEAWIDLGRVSQVGAPAEELVAKIEAGDPVEVSMGTFVDVEPKPGVFDGRRFAGIWRSIRPDHLALGVDRGACSFEDGCGVRAACANGCAGGCRGGLMDPKNAEERPGLIARVMEYLGRGRSIMAQAAEIGDRERRERLYDAIQDSDKPDYEAGEWLEIVEVFTDSGTVLYKLGGDEAYRRTFAIDDAGEVSLGEREKGRIALEFVPEAQVVASEEEKRMSKIRERVSALIASEATAFDEHDRKWLEGMTEDQIAKLEPKETTKAASSAAPTAGVSDLKPAAKPTAEPDEGAAKPPAAPKTAEQVIAEQPPELQEVLSEGLRLQSERKSALTKALRASQRCDFSDDQLAAKPLRELEVLAKLAGVDAPTPDYGLRPAARKDDDARTPPPPPVDFQPAKPAAAA